MTTVKTLFPMLRWGAALLLALLLAGAPGQGAIRVLGSLDPATAAWLDGRGFETQNLPVDASLVTSRNPDVLVVTTDAELAPTQLLAQAGGGRGIVLSNHLRTDYFEALGIKRGSNQLVNPRVSAGDSTTASFPGFLSSAPYTIRVFWGGENPDTLYSLEPLQRTFDLQRTYSSSTVIAGTAFGSGYIVIIPSAVFRSDGYYAQAEGRDPNNPTTQNRAFLAEAIQYAYQRSARAATPTPSAAPASTPAPPPATTPPTPEPTALPATPPPAATATPAASPPPARPFPVGIAIVAVIVVLVAVIVGARMRKRKPPPAPSVGLGREEVPLEPLPPPEPPPPESPPPSPT